MKPWRGSAAIAVLMAAVHAAPAQAADEAAVVNTYGDIAHAMYADSLHRAQELQQAVNALIAAPSAASLSAARTAWLQARIPYQQTEVYRFGNAIVDDWEGKVNAWPLDEGLIDYVHASYGAESDVNPLYTANVIANESLTIGTDTVGTSPITGELLAETLQEAGEVEANVATGYHAIEFLLWGQDLNGTGPGAGNRPSTDFARGPACTNGNCGRRAEYLKTATDLTVDDLAWMADQWAPGGAARDGVSVASILTGMGSLSYGELAGERMKLGLMLHDPEEEHDCFADNTYNSHYYDALGIRSVYLGHYKRGDGSVVSGPSLSALVAETDSALDADMRAALDDTMAAMAVMKHRGETIEAYDQMIAEGNAEGNAVVQAVIDSLTAQTRVIERVVGALELQPIAFEGSDSLDNPAAVFE